MDWIEKITQQVQELTPYDVKSYIEKAKNIALNVPEMEAKVREATNDDPWGASSTLMQEIAQGTFNFQEFNEILPTIYRRFMEMEARQWRQIYKALQLLEYIVKHGSERVVDDARAHISTIKMLRNFHYIDEKGKDQGINVRNRAMEIVNLLVDVDKIRAERRKAKANKQKYVGVGNDSLSGVSFNMGGARYGGFGSDTFHATYPGSSSGGGFATTGFSDNNDSRQGYEEYDAGDDDYSHSQHEVEQPKNKKPEQKQSQQPEQQEVDLFDFGEDDQPQQQNNQQSLINHNDSHDTNNDFDDFDDFQSAPVSNNNKQTNATTITSPSVIPPPIAPISQPPANNLMSTNTNTMASLNQLPQQSLQQPQQQPMPSFNLSSTSVMPNKANVSQPKQNPNPFSGFDDLWNTSLSKPQNKNNDNNNKPSMASLAQQKSSASLWDSQSPKGSNNNNNNINNDDNLLL